MTPAMVLCQYIENETGYKIGIDLFAGVMPASKEVGIILSDFGGSENETNVVKAGVQVIAIYDDYATSVKKCQEIHNFLVYTNGFYVGDSYIFNCIPLSLPKFLHQNEKGHILSTASIVCIKER